MMTMEDESKEEALEIRRRQLMSLHITTTSKTVLTERSEDNHGFNEYTRKFNLKEKYGKVLSNLFPMKNMGKKENDQFPGTEVGCLSYVTSSWLTPFMWKAYRKGISPDDIWNLDETDSANHNFSRLEYFWKEELESKGSIKASLMKAIWNFARTRTLIAVLLIVVASLCQFVGPAWLQNALLHHLNDVDSPLSWGLSLVGLLLLSQYIKNICYNTAWILGYHTAIRIMGSLEYMMYMKLLRMKAPSESTLGKLVTMCTNDQERICEAIAAGPLAIGAPLMAVLALVYSYMLLGPWTLLGNVILIGFTPLLVGIAAIVNGLRLDTAKLSDRRVYLTNNVLSNIRLIKMYAWERSFFNQIIDVRKQEHKLLKLAAFLQSLGTSLTPTSAAVASTITFMGYTLAGNDLKATDAFALLTVFNGVLFSIGRLPYVIRCIGEAEVSLDRVKEYLANQDFEPLVEKSATEHTLSIELTNSTFAWETAQVELKKMKQKGKKKPSRLVFSQDNSKVLATVLFDLNLKVKRGTLLGVCGGVGSGKSSLLSALVGELNLLSGKMNLEGTIAYVTQQAWIFNDTVQENILFGLPYNEQRYNATIAACGLKRDLQILLKGDMTEAGENGFNLSGGQKQRISLARAVYSNRDVYLLDDTLSAVDASVASHIIQNCLCGKNAMLYGKTIILATHSIMALEGCDRVIVLKDGAIVEDGTPTELAKIENGEYALLLNQMSEETGAANAVVQENIPAQSKADEQRDNEDNKENEDEKYDTTPIKKTFRKYIKMCGGFCLTFSVASTMIIFSIFRLFNSTWLQTWLDAGDGSYFQLFNSSNENEVHARHVNETESIQFVPWKTHDGNTSFENGPTYEFPINHNISHLKSLHDKHLYHNGINISNLIPLMEVGESNFGINLSNIIPLHEGENGRMIDNPDLLFYLSIYVASLVFIIVSCIFKSYANSVLLLRGSKNLHNTMLDSVIRKPVSFFDRIQSGHLLNRFTKDMDEVDVRLPYFIDATWQGIVSILAQIVLVCAIFPYFTIIFAILAAIFILMDVWTSTSVTKMKSVSNTLQSPVVHFLSSTVTGLSIIRAYEREKVFREKFHKIINRHLASELLYRLSTCWYTFRMDLLATAAVVSTALITVLTKGTVTVAEAGNALSCIFIIGIYLATLMRLKADAKSRFTSVEKILEYTQGPVEPDYGTFTPPESWPEYGSVKFDNVCMRYSPQKPLVLKGVTIEIHPGEKVGIVGRTGAGKSTLISALMRLNELESGRLLIDGVDISKVGLIQLRAALAIIPQDPVLFSGTLRYNLDPFDEHTDSVLWDALDKAHLKRKAQKDDKGLMMVVEADGENFSLGEKQLVCLARALLRRNKILILDEATASVDVMTDRLIQMTISDAFSHCTVLTIAHRLDTILSYDRIVVMDNGRVAEFDKPDVLRKREDSIFKSMLDAMGIQSSK